MTPMDLQDRSQYLSLALFSQKIVSALVAYADDNKSDQLRSALTEALDSLLQTNRPTVAAQRPVAFTSYEQLRTLGEVWSPKERKEAIRLIRAIVRSPRDPKSKSLANKLIDLFARLQNQALWNFEQPKPVSQKVITRLCQMA